MSLSWRIILWENKFNARHLEGKKKSSLIKVIFVSDVKWQPKKRR